MLSICLFHVDSADLRINDAGDYSSGVSTSDNVCASLDVSTKAENSDSVCELISTYGSLSYRSILRYDKSAIMAMFIFAVLLSLFITYTAISYKTVNHSQFFIIHYIHDLDGMKA